MTQAKKETLRKTILVDNVTTGKIENGVFSLTYRKKLVNTSPFNLKAANERYGFQHHFEMSDIEALAKKFPESGLFAYADRQEKTGANLTLQTWGDIQQHLLCKFILAGGFDLRQETETQVLELAVQWKGDAIPEPAIKTVPEKKERQKQDDAAKNLQFQLI